MNAAELRERINSKFLQEIDEVQFPSVAMLDRVESTLDDREALASYAEVLVKKIEATQFPSVALLNRLDRLIARLDEPERAQAAAAQ